MWKSGEEKAVTSYILGNLSTDMSSNREQASIRESDGRLQVGQRGYDKLCVTLFSRLSLALPLSSPDTRFHEQKKLAMVIAI